MRNKLVQPLPENIATRIKLIEDIIVDLADSLDTEEDLWEAWRGVNRSQRYLSAKHTIAKNNEEYLGGKDKD